MKKSLIIGIPGQDGAQLVNLLLQKDMKYTEKLDAQN
jgi:GDP-D-mannose dehydratase